MNGNASIADSGGAINYEDQEVILTKTLSIGGEDWPIEISQVRGHELYYARCERWITEHDRVGLIVLGPCPTPDAAMDDAQHWTAARLMHGPRYMGQPPESGGR